MKDSSRLPPLLLHSSLTQMTAEKIEDNAEVEADNAGLQRALKLLNSATASTYACIRFPAKWHLIRNKLEHLISILAAASSSTEATSVLAEATSAIAVETQLLAQQCSDETYTGGKLQLRSDLDMAASKLQAHITNLAQVYASGSLTQSRAIILSRPGAGASRDDMRFYVNDLFSRMRIGGPDMRARALTALNEIIPDDEKYVSIVAAETEDGISFLVSLLEFDEFCISALAAEAVDVIARFDGYKGVLISAGVIAQLVRLLERGSWPARERAALALKKLTENSDNAWSVSAQGGVTVLLKIVCSSDSGMNLTSTVCSILRNLSGVMEIRRFMVEEKLVSILVKLSHWKEESIQIQSIEFLSALAYEDGDVKQEVIREGMIESLVQLLDPNTPGSSKAREVSIKAIECVCASSMISMNFLLGSEFLNHLLFFLRNGELSVQESSLKAVFNFSSVSEELKKTMGEIGFMQELVKLLEARPFEVRETAAKALCNMVSVQRNRRRLIRDDHNVDRIMQLLDPEAEKLATKKFLLSVLMHLTNSNIGRRKIMASGYVRNFEMLAETDVDAKKIIKKLSGNKFRSIMNGIWS